MNDEDDFNDIDAIMAEDPLGLSKQKLDRIIVYQRKQRTLREQGVKPKKPKGERPPALALSELLASLPKPQPGPKKISTFRRR